MTSPLIIGNWKLNGTRQKIQESLSILTKEKIIQYKKHIDVAIAPPIVYLSLVNDYLLKNCTYFSNQTKHKYIELCAQNVDINLSGAFTGDISAAMLKDLGVKYVLIGHSERRKYHKENTTYIAKKITTVKKIKLIPILCIGENQQDYDSGSTQLTCAYQIDSVINLTGIQAFKNTIIAYEPIWAIGNGINVCPKHVQSIHEFIRQRIALHDTHIAKQILIQYGGSVNLNNAIQLLEQKDVNGLLIGAASLNMNTFIQIIQTIEQYLQNKLY
ncbi:triosephosphate isomerase [Candidatus Blochmanniella vafra str. BVAF]|uniref:Triosephosphate isomerase n=1 Tax=Blochmanniella vafra (strain BVAF) TaxID=859654 RepID=E8Q780_BLOVB|nr:triose-phosphate isomerase [Candidatus Blochmannia vafer]ADV33975.1 triosephosphate isomerase [Candidatus Blochmannia vafer str. BVAF]